MSQDHNEPQPRLTSQTQERARLGPLQRLTGTIFSPGETFEDVNRKPTWVIPILIGIVLAVGTGLFFEWRVKPDWDRVLRPAMRQQLERRGQQVSEEQLSEAVEQAKWYGRYAPFLPIVAVPLVIALLSGVYALGLLIIQAQTNFGKVLSVVAWSWAGVGLVQTLVRIASLMVRDPETIDPTRPDSLAASSLAAFLPADSGPVLRTFAAQFDVFTIWWLILLSIGFAVTGGTKRMTTRKAAALVFSLFAIWLPIRAGIAALFGR